MFLNPWQFPRLTVSLAKVSVCLRIMERLTIPSELLASTVRDIAQMGELGDMGSDLDAGVAVGIPALDALQMVLRMKVQASLSIVFPQFDSFHTLDTIDLFRNNFPSPAVDNKGSVLAHEP